MYPVDESVDLQSFVDASLREVTVNENQIGFIFSNQNTIVLDYGPLLFSRNGCSFECNINPPAIEVFSFLGSDVMSVELGENK
jgi:hypothetical protein